MRSGNRRTRTVLVSIACAAALAAPAAAQDAPAPAAADLERGAEIYELCAACHGDAGQGNAMYLAPAIGGMPLWYLQGQLNKFREGGRGTHFDDLPGMRMRPVARSLGHSRGNDLEDVAAYVASLPVPKPERTLSGGDPARGAAHYAVCQACHGTAGEGVQATNGPPLAHQSDWYLLSSLERFKNGVRGSAPNDPNGAVMRGMAAILQDEQAMKDVIAHVIGLAGGQ
jgi:cytochrome c oxidase subunit 2